jgi:hypothetical protein
MGKIPMWPTLWNQIAATMTSNATRWQDFYDDLKAGNVDTARVFTDLEGTTMDWLDVWATAIGAGGAPTPPTVFIKGDNWQNTQPTRSGTARIETPIDPTTTVNKTTPLVLLGGGTNTYPLSVGTAELRENGTQIYVEVSRSSTSGQNPANGLHTGVAFTDGGTFLASILVWVG